MIEEIAQLYVKKRDIRRAIEKYKEILNDYKDEPKIYMEIGSLFALCSEFTKSKKYLEQAVKMDPSLSLAKIRLGKLEYKNFHRIDVAISLFNSIPEDDKESFKAKYQLGIIYWKKLTEYEIGMDFIKESLRINPKYVLGWTTIGDFLIERNNHASARRFYEKAKEIDPNNVKALIGLGMCYMKNNETLLAYNQF